MTAQFVEAAHSNLTSTFLSTSWVIIDSNVNCPQVLVNAVDKSSKVILLDANRDGVEQITQLFQSAEIPPSNLYLLSHGAPGILYLGNAQLDLTTLAAYSEQVKAWSAANLYLYGCNVAAGDAGQEFLQKLHGLTQANIAASTNKIGHSSQGGNWNLDFAYGSINYVSPFTASIHEDYPGVFATSIVVTEDNANNSSTVDSQIGPEFADNDFGRGIRVGANFAQDSEGNFLGNIQPIEFSFFVDTPIDPTLSHQLFLSVFDVDRNPEDPTKLGEIDEVRFNGNLLGILEGQDELSYRTRFQLDPSFIRQGNNLVQIDVDINNLKGPNKNEWEAEIERAELLLNYERGSSNGTAFLDFSQTDQADYDPGEQVLFTGDIDTTLETQRVQIEAILRNPNGEAVQFDTRSSSTSYLLTGTDDTDAFTWRVTLPDDALPGFWSIDLGVFNTGPNGDFQFLGSESFSVGVVSPVFPPSEIIVFQFKDYVRFQELEDNRPYQGPNAIFDTQVYEEPKYFSDEELYLLANPDVKAAVDSGLFTSGAEHYTVTGAREGRNLLPLDIEIGGLRVASFFDETFYLIDSLDVRDAVTTGSLVYGFEHFLEWGLIEGRNPSRLYNGEYYLNNNADVRAAVEDGRFVSGLEHYLLFGHVENRNPSALFEAQDYLANNPDVAAAVENGIYQSGFDHYIEAGASEGRINTLLFEESFYLNNYPDVAAAVAAGTSQSAFEHYVLFGQSEGRDPGPLFDESIYRTANPDVVAAINAGGFSSGMEHFFEAGRQEGRNAYLVTNQVPTAASF